MWNLLNKKNTYIIHSFVGPKVKQIDPSHYTNYYIIVMKTVFGFFSHCAYKCKQYARTHVYLFVCIFFLHLNRALLVLRNVCMVLTMWMDCQLYSIELCIGENIDEISEKNGRKMCVSTHACTKCGKVWLIQTLRRIVSHFVYLIYLFIVVVGVIIIIIISLFYLSCIPRSSSDY